MAATDDMAVIKRAANTTIPTKSSLTLEGKILEAWGEGFNVGALIILLLIVICNYSKGKILHKLIVLEMFLALWHGTFIFCSDPVYGWYLSSTVILLFTSYQVHNLVAWMKIRPFLPRWGGRLYICTLIAVQPFWIAECWLNFEYFNDLGNSHSKDSRPWEALARDPWWIFTTCRLLYIIKRGYYYSFKELMSISPRFGVLIFCMLLSICFLIVDVIVSAAKLTTNSGINPYWRMALVFKCASDTMFLDDFKSVLDAISSKSLSRAGGLVHRGKKSGHQQSRQQGTSPQAFSSESAGYGPMVTIRSDHPQRSSRKKWEARIFRRRDEENSPKDMSIQRETTITLSNMPTKRNSDGSFGSGNRILPKPMPTATRQQQTEQSHG